MRNNIIKTELGTLKRVSLVYRAVLNKTRQEIINFIWDAPKTVTEIMTEVGLPQSQVSSHLAALRKSGLVKTNKDGKLVYYGIKYETFEAINETSKKIMECISTK